MYTLRFAIVLALFTVAGCANPLYGTGQDYSDVVGADTEMNCTTDVTTYGGANTRCRGHEKMTKADALRAADETRAINAASGFFDQLAPFVVIRSQYPYNITQGRYNRRLYGEWETYRYRRVWRYD